MPKDFQVPSFYRSSTIGALKRYRSTKDPKRRDLSPSILACGEVRFHIARHFGFCYGVENAIDIAYRAVEENPGRKIFLLSEMIHNPQVNADLISRGVSFLMTTGGERLVDLQTLTPDDIVIVPAFGTTLELHKELAAQGVNPSQYDATCPFVEKVWRRASELGERGYSVVIHGKRAHEETRATFSHSKEGAPTVVVRDMTDTDALCSFIQGDLPLSDFWSRFTDATSKDFDPEQHLSRVGVVNQTTMLATETLAIAERIKSAMLNRYGREALAEHFADTRDTLCYATNENQSATRALMECGSDFAIVVGGYKSSNTSHLVELLETVMPTYYIETAEEIISSESIRHFSLHENGVVLSSNWLPQRRPLNVAITSGASCPDKSVDLVLERLVELTGQRVSPSEALEKFEQ